MLVRYRTLTTLLVALASALFALSAAQAAPPRDLDRYAQRALETFETPGMSVTIVEQDRAPVVRSYGVRRVGEAAKIDPDTVFGIGSTTKAFTSALLAMLVDEGKLTWDTKVSDVLPGFKMYDPYASSEMTVRDLLVHRSGLGLGAGDLMFYPPTTLTREEIVHKLRYIKPATSFRSAYAYDNLLYVVAGEVIEAVAGMSWEDAIRTRIFAPLQMKGAFAISTLPADANRAWPHARISSDVRGSGPLTPLEKAGALDNAAPAGALNVGGADIARWLELQLGRGLDPRTKARLWSERQAKEMWTSQTLMPIGSNPKGLELAQASFRAYALGWNVSDYRGEQILSHGGGVPGSVTLVVLAPKRGVAFALMTNSESGGALVSLQYRLLDHYLGLDSPDWIAAVSDMYKTRIAKAQETLAAAMAERPAGEGGSKGPSLPLAKYAGRYKDAWYGAVTIEEAGDGLRISFQHTPTLSGPLEHVRHDTFRTQWPDPTIEDAYVTFALKPDGSIDRVTMKAVSPIADFSFDYHDLLLLPE